MCLYSRVLLELVAVWARLGVVLFRSQLTIQYIIFYYFSSICINLCTEIALNYFYLSTWVRLIDIIAIMFVYDASSRNQLVKLNQISMVSTWFVILSFDLTAQDHNSLANQLASDQEYDNSNNRQLWKSPNSLSRRFKGRYRFLVIKGFLGLESDLQAPKFR